MNGAILKHCSCSPQYGLCRIPMPERFPYMSFPWFFKASLFNDEETLSEILQCHNPRKAKALGRKVQNFDEDVWNEARYEIVLEGNRLKFSQNEGLKEILLSTGDLDIAEAAPNDRSVIRVVHRYLPLISAFKKTLEFPISNLVLFLA